MRGLLLLAVASSGCATQTITRTMMTPLPPQLATAAVPERFATLGAGATALPFGLDVSKGPSAQASGTMVPQVQPELFGMVKVGEHLLLGGQFYFAPAEWAVRSSAGQSGVHDAMYGARSRVGLWWRFENGMGFTCTIEPGFDLIPVTYSYGIGASQTDLTLMPGIATTMTPFYEIGPVRVFLGLSASTLPVISSTVTVSGGCISGCAEAGIDLTGIVSVAGGARVRLIEGLALAATAVMPVTRDDLPWSPMLSLSLQADLDRRAPAEPRERVAEPDDPRPVEPPPAPPAPPAPQQL